MLKAARGFKPQTIVSIGDFADCYAVSSHSKDPRRIADLEDEIGNVREGLDELDALNAKEKIFIEGNHCLALDHRALTPTGWATVDDLAVGDLVATQSEAGFLEWQPIERVVRREVLAGERLLTYQSRGVSLRITDQHRVVGTSNDITWIRPAYDCPSTFDLPVATASGLPDYPLSDDLLRLAAWASTDVHYITTSDGVVFYQSEGKEHLIRDLLTRLGLTFTERCRRRTITEICGKVLKVPCKPSYEFTLSAESGRLVRDLTGLEEKGHLPVWVRDLSDAQWDTFLTTLIDADGSIPTRATSSRVFYGQRPLCEDVQIAAILHGWRASITEYRSGQFRVNLTDTTCIRVMDWGAMEMPTPGEDVWCLTVANGNFFTERDGKVHLTGNCDRLRRYLSDKAPELFGTVSIPRIFNLPERGWRYVPYKSDTKLGKLYLTHDVGNAGRFAAHKALDTYQHSVVTGHSHRMSYIVEGNAVGEHKVSAMFGWLGDVNSIDYMHAVKARKDWALGFGIGHLDPTSGIVYLTPVPIVKYTCVLNGRLHRG